MGNSMNYIGCLFRWSTYVLFIIVDICILLPASCSMFPHEESVLYTIFGYTMSFILAAAIYNLLSCISFLVFGILYYIYSKNDIDNGEVDRPKVSELPRVLIDSIPKNTIHSLWLHITSLVIGYVAIQLTQ